MRLSELGDISKAKDNQNRRGLRGRDVAAAGGAAYLGGAGTMVSGIKAMNRSDDEMIQALRSGKMKNSDIPSMPTRGVKRFVGGGALNAAGSAAILGGGAIGAYNMSRAGKERKRAHELALARARREG